MKASQRKSLLPHLDQTTRSIEGLLQAGLTTASEATLKSLAVTFEQASKLGLLRLSSTLRSTQQEISRYIHDDASFSATRMTFFLHRSWLLCKGLHLAIESDDEATIERLLWTPPTTNCDRVRVVCLGVVKKVANDNFCAFEFRLRDIETKRRLLWSVAFPLKKGKEIPAEGFLHLPQKQKFKPAVFTKGNVIEIENCLIADHPSCLRIQMIEASQVKEREAYDAWQEHLIWDSDAALKQVQEHTISPLDVDIELQQEIVLQEYSIAAPNDESSDTSHEVWPLTFRGEEFDLTLSQSEEGEAARDAMKRLVKTFGKKPPPAMYGLMHYAAGRKVLSPLAFFESKCEVPEYISLSDKAVDSRALLAALKF